MNLLRLILLGIFAAALGLSTVFLQDADRNQSMEAIAEPDKRALAEFREKRRDLEQEIEQRARTADQDGSRKDQESERKKGLLLKIETASAEVMPWQPLVIRAILVNEGGLELTPSVPLTVTLACLRVSVKSPGSVEFRPIALFGHADGPGAVPPEEKMHPRGHVSVQADLPVILGHDPERKTFTAGKYTLKIGLGEADPAELEVQLIEPAGADRELMNRIREHGLQGILGTQAPSRFHKPLKEVPAALEAVEDLCDRHPRARYAPDLRIGSFLVLNQLKDRLTPPWSREEIERRLTKGWRAILASDRPSGWPRAEILIPLARRAEIEGENPLALELLRDFLRICPDDIRVRPVTDRISSLVR